jgi:tetratricopeptide (TPR) repeat protein
MPAEPAVAGHALALRPVRGRPLADAVADYRRAPSMLGLHDLLRPFVAACREVACAHARGATHLSLTPRLILVGEFGETAVVGWDHARPVPLANGERGPATAEPDAYAAAFLAPEQAAGDETHIGPASDVYALGAILYLLLTGQAPYAGATAAEVLSRVREGLAWQPRMVAGRVPAALEGVCLTAMERQPGERYASAAELAREVERWMAGERVRTNYVEPKGVRLMRWARGGYGLTALAGLLLLSLLALAVAVKVILTERAHVQEEGNRIAAEGTAGATAALHRAQQYVEEVNRQRQLASAEFAGGVQVLRVLALKAQARPGEPAALAAYKADLLRTVLEGARQMAGRAAQVGGNDVAAAQDHVSLAELFTTLGQADDARGQYERAVAITRARAKVQPDNVAAQHGLEVAALGLGKICLLQGQANLARNLAREAHAAAEAWARLEPSNPLAKREAAACLDLLAAAALALHDLPAARAAFDTMTAAVEGYAKADSPNLLDRFDLASAYVARGNLERLDHRYEDAVAWYDRALAIVRPLKAGGKLEQNPLALARLKDVEALAQECRDVLKSIDDSDVALNQPAEKAMPRLVGRAAVLARRGRPADAAATAERLRQLKPQDAVTLYNVACCYALCVPAVAAGKPADALTDEEKGTQAEYARRALEALRAAADHGFRNVAKIESDPDLDALHQEAGYRALVGELKALPVWLTFPALP